MAVFVACGIAGGAPVVQGLHSSRPRLTRRAVALSHFWCSPTLAELRKEQSRKTNAAHRSQLEPES
jgi:hypothetical protein